MVKKSAKKKTPSKVEGKILSRSLRVYQKLAVFFVVISLFLLLGVLYLSISRATIRVTPVPHVVTASSLIKVTSQPLTPGEVGGFVVTDTFTKAKSFTLPSEGGSPVERKATGKVTLINDTNARVDLVATTRLLSEDGVLFRLVEAAVIPANSFIEADVAADVPGKSGEIGPSKFTIPGLSPARQEVVHAVSVDSMTGGLVYIRQLTETDLNQAEQELRKEILDEARELFAEDVDRELFGGDVFSIDILDKTSDTLPGSETGTFNVSVTARVTGVFYDKNLVFQQAKEGVYEAVPDGYELVHLNEEGFQTGIKFVNIEDETADLGLYLDGVSRLSKTHEVFELDALVGKSPVDAKRLLEQSEAIETVEVIFTPFWLKRIPALKDHIKIVIREVR